MSRVVVCSRVGADGVLQLCVPVGRQHANRDVEVTIAIAEPKDDKVAQEEWRQFVLSTAGAWQGELERPPQGEYEQRDELP